MRRSGALMPLFIGLLAIVAVFFWLPASFFTLSGLILITAIIWSLVRWRSRGG
ncbi:MAG: hypothetical protein AAFQ66_16965 [Pseudomonadota bacterium]